MELLYVKSLHLIFVISWFAGLFYIVRLFIYHVEAKAKPEPEQTILTNQYALMQHRLWYIITWPAAVLATVFGYYMVYLLDYWEVGWMLSKIAMTSLLWVYHIANHLIFLRAQKGTLNWTSNQLRLWNELATLFMVSIVFIVVLKNQLNWIYGTLGFFGVAILLMIGIRVYKRFRNK